MEITVRNMQILWRTAAIKYQNALRPTKAWSIASGLCETLPLTTLQSEQYWLARLPAMQRLTKDKVMNALSAHGQQITAREWDLSFAIKRKFVKYDQWGLFDKAVQMAGDRGSKVTDYALADFLKTNPRTQPGTNAYMCYDGEPFFSTAHPTNGGDVSAPVPTGVAATQSNLYLSTPLTVSNFATVYANMMSAVDETGRPWDVTPDTLFVGPQLRHVAREICQSDLIADIAAAAAASTTVSAASVPAVQSNVEKNVVKLVVVPDLYYAPGAWLLAQTGGVLKPFVWAQLEAPHLIPSIDPGSTNVFLKQEFWYSVEALAEIAPTLWPLCSYATSAATYGS